MAKIKSFKKGGGGGNSSSSEVKPKKFGDKQKIRPAEGEGGGIVKKKNAQKKKFGKKKREDVGRNMTASPKPKSLKKTPGKGSFKNNKGDGGPQKKGPKRKEEGAEEESQETKERIRSIRNQTAKGGLVKNIKLVVKPGGKWYEESELDKAPSDDLTSVKHEVRNVAKEELHKIRKSAENLLDNDCHAYKQTCLQGDQKSDFRWMEKMMKVGTLPDKMAAYVVKIQDSPVHNLHHLQNLVSMVKAQSKQQCLIAADTLKDLFLEDLLPPDRKLIMFDKRGSSLLQSNKISLIKWMYEDRLKLCFKGFIDALRRMSLDTVDKIRAKAILIIYQLLSTHPEQEAELLQMLVNKLGDPIKKVGSRALFYLNSLLENHPRMKMVVVDEVERLLFRNNIAVRAQYYGICFLNTINLKDEHPEIACKLINVYLAFFKGCIKTGNIDSKMMSGLLTGVNKAYPLAKELGFKFTENVDTLYKIVHLSNFTIAIQALSILFQLTDIENNPSQADRYYRSLYSELLRPEIATTAHNLQFLNLIFKSMKCDDNVNRVMGFSKRLLQICQSVQPNLACAILFLLSEVSKAHVGIIRVGENVPEIDLKDSDEEEVEEIDHDSAHRDEEKIRDLIKISNVQVEVPEDNHSIKESKQIKDITSSLTQVHDESVGQDKEENTNGGDFSSVKSEQPRVSKYDPFARNPRYCGAEFSLSYEIAKLTDHYHPSVSLFAKRLLHHQHIVYDGNPLKDFTIARFLERFVYKNSKKPKMTHGTTRSYQPKGLRNVPVNSDDYLNQNEEKIPEEEMFFYRYFKEKKTSKEVADEDSETESVGDDEFDELMANYFKSAKGADQEDDDDFDVDFAAEIHSKAPEGGKRKKGDDSESEDEDVENQYSDEGEFGAADDADEMLDDDDADLDFHEEDGLDVFEEDDFEDEAPKKKKFKKSKGVDMFAPAEEFAEMLESNADEGLSGPSTLINRDNADAKQLHWEQERDRWVKGYKRTSKTTFKKVKRQQKKK